MSEPAAGAGRIPFTVVTKPAGATCNLDCAYCYFLSKDLLYPSRPHAMSEDVLKAYIAQTIAGQPGDHAELVFQGGEPTMRGLNFFRRAVELARQHRRPDGASVDVRFVLQTNGTLLDDEWCEFLAEHHFLVGLSIDGPADLHDVYRVNRAGRGTLRHVLRGWELLRRHGVDTNVLTTVNAVNAAHPLRVYRFLRDELGARYIQFIPVVERTTVEELPAAEAGWGAGRAKRPGDEQTPPPTPPDADPARSRAARRVLYTQHGTCTTSRSVTGEAYGAFLETIFDEWVARDVGTVYVQLFDAVLANAFGQDTLCVHAPECGHAPALEPGGDVYACDHYVEPGYRLGNVADTPLAELVASPAQREFGRAKRTALPGVCRRCPVRWACHGGCPKDRFARAPDGEEGLNVLCAGYRSFFGHATPYIARMADLIRAGRAPAQLMDELAR